MRIFIILGTISTDGIQFILNHKLPLNNPVITTVATVNKLTTVNMLLIIVDSRTPHDSKTVMFIG